MPRFAECEVDVGARIDVRSALLQHARDSVVIWELRGDQAEIIFFNAGAELLYAIPSRDALGRSLDKLLRTEPPLASQPIRASLENQGFWEGDLLQTTPSGRRILVESRLTSLATAKGRCVMQIDRDTTARKAAQTSLEDADRHKDEFLAMLSHELRNPLAPIQAAVETLERVGPQGPHHGEVLGILKRQTEQLTRLVDDLLDVSRVSFDKLELKKGVVDVAAVVTRAVETSRPLIEARGHVLAVVTPQEPLAVEGDLARLAQVIANLLNNAAKYTEPGGHIRLSVCAEGGDVVFRVQDDGAGIPSHLLPRMFDLFAQGPRACERVEGGLGIGLTLVRRLVQLHGGRVEGFSNTPEPGSTFVVRLPALRRHSGFVRKSPGEGPDLAKTRQGKPAVRLRILVVDDNVDAAESIALYLELDGHEILKAHSGEDAIAIAKTFRPHIVLLDIGLPLMDGYECCRLLRSDPATATAKLVALTGYGQDEDRRRSWQAGFDGHLTKPVAPATLAVLVQSHCEHAATSE